VRGVVMFVALAAAGLGFAAYAEDSRAIVQMGRAFHPGETTIARGETLIFSNHDDFIHQIYVASNAMSFDSAEQSPGQNVEVTFPATGTFEVRCHIHPKMRLVVHVK
jgi:plastocyanin